MKIGFDVSQTCESKSGTGFWADQLIRSLACIDKKNKYTLLPWFYDYRPRDISAATEIRQGNFETKILMEFNDNDPVIQEQDIIHSNNFRFPANVSAKKVVTIYDVCFLDYPEYTTEANRIFCYKGTMDSVIKADKIIAISEYTKDRLLHFFPFINSSKIEVVYCGNRNALLEEKENKKILQKFGLEENEFFLSVGTIEPRKNYDTLLKAYKQYSEKVSEKMKLCIAGGRGWLEDNFKKKIASLGLEDNVVVTGYVSEAELSNLYRFCHSFLYPTWYEGFGMPILEAMNFHKPIVASRTSSIPEIVGDAAVLIEPGNQSELSMNMLRLQESSDLRSELISKERSRLDFFTWDRAARRMLEIYESLLD